MAIFCCVLTSYSSRAQSSWALRPAALWSATPQTTTQTAAQTPSGPPLEIPIHTATTPSDVLDLITADTATISEEGKTIVNTVIKVMQLINNQKKKIAQLQSHASRLENRIKSLESFV